MVLLKKKLFSMYRTYLEFPFFSSVDGMEQEFTCWDNRITTSRDFYGKLKLFHCQYLILNSAPLPPNQDENDRIRITPTRTTTTCGLGWAQKSLWIFGIDSCKFS